MNLESILEYVLSEQAVEYGDLVVELSPEDIVSRKLPAKPGEYTWEKEIWTGPNGMQVENEGVIGLLNAKLTPDQVNAILQDREHRRQLRRGGAAAVNPTQAGESEQEWERNHRSAIEAFRAEARKPGTPQQEFTVNSAGLSSELFGEYSDNYCIFDPGRSDYVVIASARTRRSGFGASHGQGTYIFRKESPNAIPEFEVFAGEPYTSYIKKITPRAAQQRGIGMQNDPTGEVDPNQFRAEAGRVRRRNRREQGQPPAKQPKIEMRENAKRFDLGFILRRDMHQQNLVKALSGEMDYNSLRAHTAEFVESAEPFADRLSQILTEI